MKRSYCLSSTNTRRREMGTLENARSAKRKILSLLIAVIVRSVRSTNYYEKKSLNEKR